MALDPQVQGIIAAMNETGLMSDGFDPIAFRAAFEQMVPQMWDASGIALERIEDDTFTGADGTELALRIYIPSQSDRPLPVMVFFHGGGFSSGSVNTADPHCRYFATQANVIVISADYRLAPEHKHPAGLEDCYAALQWTTENAAGFGGDPKRISVGGDAPGANYAAAVCLMARDRGGPPIKSQFLLSPATDFVTDYPGKRQGLEIGPVGPGALRDIERMLFADEAQKNDWRVSPLFAEDHSGLPPAFLMCGEYDFLAPEIKAYADKLTAAGVPTTFQCWPGACHNFFSMYDQLEVARVAMRNAAHHLAMAAH